MIMLDNKRMWFGLWNVVCMLYAGEEYKLLKHSWHAATIGFAVSDIYRI